MKRIIILFAFVIILGIAAPAYAQTEGEEALKIDEPGTYTLTGSMVGSVVVDPGKGEVTLVMDDVTVKSDSSPAIQALSGEALHVVLRSGSCNRIETGGDAAFYTKVDTDLKGAGCLGVMAPLSYGMIAEGASLSFDGGEYLICSGKAGIKGGELTLNGGKIFINSGSTELTHVKDIHDNGGLLVKSDAEDVCSICTCCGKATLPCQKNCDKGSGKTCESSNKKCCCKKCCTSTMDRPGFIAEGITSNSAGRLRPRINNATDIVFGVSRLNRVIDTGGTFILSGRAGNGSITVKKGTKGVVLVLRNLDLTNSSGAIININDNAEVQIVVEGKVVLRDRSAKANKGAAIRVGKNTAVHVTGKGSIRIESTYDGIASGKNSSLVIAGNTKMDITAGHSGIRSEGDIAVKSGSIKVAAENDGMHSNNVLTIGEKGQTGPSIKVTKCKEGLEGNTVNIKSGDISINSGEDGIEAERQQKSPDPSVNISGGNIEIKAKGSAIDSDGNVNIEGGDIKISSGKGKNCIDHDGGQHIDEDANIECDCDNE